MDEILPTVVCQGVEYGDERDNHSMKCTVIHLMLDEDDGPYLASWAPGYRPVS